MDGDSLESDRDSRRQGGGDQDPDIIAELEQRELQINKLLNKLSQFLLCTKWIDEGLFDCRDLHHSKVATGRREHLPDGNVSPFGNNPANQMSG